MRAEVWAVDIGQWTDEQVRLPCDHDAQSEGALQAFETALALVDDDSRERVRRFRRREDARRKSMSMSAAVTLVS